MKHKVLFVEQARKVLSKRYNWFTLEQLRFVSTFQLLHTEIKLALKRQESRHELLKRAFHAPSNRVDDIIKRYDNAVKNEWFVDPFIHFL